MGGKVFKETNIRLGAAQFKELEKTILNSIPSSYSIPSYKNKKTYGDIDILVDDKVNYESYLVKAGLNWLAKSRNGKVVSYALDVGEGKTFQLDIIETPSEDIESSIFYFSHNDLNNLVGKIARQFSLSFGFKGLSYVYKKQGREIKFLLTKNPQQIYEFLGLDWDRYLLGFDNLEDIFEFVMSSDYFSTTYFTLESLNHKHRKRDRVRHTYHSFLEYIKDIKTGTSVAIIPFDLIESTFEVSQQITQYENWLEKQEIDKQFWSGYTVLDHIPSIDKKEINSFMNFCQKEFTYMLLRDLEESQLSHLLSNMYEMYQDHKQF